MGASQSSPSPTIQSNEGYIRSFSTGAAERVHRVTTARQQAVPRPHALSSMIHLELSGIGDFNLVGGGAASAAELLDPLDQVHAALLHLYQGTSNTTSQRRFTSKAWSSTSNKHRQAT